LLCGKALPWDLLGAIVAAGIHSKVERRRWLEHVRPESHYDLSTSSKKDR
jgi:hypothetical protein